MVPSLFVGLVLTAALAGASGAYAAGNMNHKVTIHVDQLGDPDMLGMVTVMRLTLTNIGSDSVSPRFFVQWSVQPYLWTILNGTESFSSGYSQSYTIVPSDPVAAVPNNADFRVWVYDSESGILFGQSNPTRVKIVTPVIVNPDFKWWSLDLAAGVKVPYGWKLHESNADPVGSGISWSNSTTLSGVHLALNYTGRSSDPGAIFLTQTVSANLTVADLLLESEFAAPTGQSEIFGSLIADGIHLMYIIFSDSVTKQTVQTYEANTTVIIPFQVDTLGILKVRVVDLWLSQSWTLPNRLSLSFFIEARQAGLYNARVDRVSQEVTSGSSRNQ